MGLLFETWSLITSSTMKIMGKVTRMGAMTTTLGIVALRVIPTINLCSLFALARPATFTWL